MKQLITSYTYEIEDTISSESAHIFFTRSKIDGKPVVIKVLRHFEDSRYRQATPEKRRQYQIEALRWNRKFSPAIYRGLAPVIELNKDQGIICIGNALNLRSIKQQASNTEFALLMKPLPGGRSLDKLLQTIGDENELLAHLKLLIRYLARLHMKLPRGIDRKEERSWWGSIEQLEKKLRGNLEDFERAIEKYPEQEEICIKLKTALPKILRKYEGYFIARLERSMIKRCHGDLKSSNIWILPAGKQCERQPGRCVRLIDAIDFNESYYYIDILSDFALLIADIYARTGSIKVAESLIEYYFMLTNQEKDEISRTVLTYYILEKTVVCATNSFLHENQPAFGEAYLASAEAYLREF